MSNEQLMDLLEQVDFNSSPKSSTRRFRLLRKYVSARRVLPTALKTKMKRMPTKIK